MVGLGLYVVGVRSVYGGVRHVCFGVRYVYGGGSVCM